MDEWNKRKRFPRHFRRDIRDTKKKANFARVSLGHHVSYLSNWERERWITLERSRRFYGGISKK